MYMCCAETVIPNPTYDTNHHYCIVLLQYTTPHRPSLLYCIKTTNDKNLLYMM